MSSHYIELGNSRRLYFDIGSKSTPTEAPKNFLVEIGTLTAAFPDELPIGFEQAKELTFEVNVNNFNGSQSVLFKGYDSAFYTNHGTLIRYNRWWIEEYTGFGWGFGNSRILFEGVQDLRPEEELELEGINAGVIEITVTCQIKRFLEWLKMDYMLASHNYVTTYTDGNPSYSSELRELCYKIGSKYYTTRASRFLSGGVTNPYRAVILRKMQDLLDFILNSSYNHYTSGLINSPYEDWDQIVRRTTNGTIATTHTPLSHWTLYSQNDAGKEYATATSNAISAGSTTLNPETEVYLPMGEQSGKKTVNETDRAATGYFGERDLEGSVWDFLTELTKGFCCKATIKYDQQCTIQFHPINDFMDTSSTYTTKVYKSVNTITRWRDARFLYHKGYVANCEIQTDEIFLKGGTKKQGQLSDYLVYTQNNSFNSSTFDARVLYNNIPSDRINETWAGPPLDGIGAPYHANAYRNDEDGLPPNKINKLCNKVTRSLSRTDDNPDVQYLMVHPDCKVLTKSGTEYAATSTVQVFQIKDTSDNNYFKQNKANESVRQNAGMAKAYSKAIIGEFGAETRFALEMTLDSDQIDIRKLGEKFEISGGIDSIINGGASWLSGALTNELICVSIEWDIYSDSYVCIFTGK